MTSILRGRADLRARSGLVWLLAASMLFVGMGLTGLILGDETGRLSTERSLELERRADAAKLQLETGLKNHLDLVIGLRAFMQAAGSATRSEFSTYVGSIDVASRFPGAQAIEWGPVVDRDEIESFEDSVRADDSLVLGGYPQFEIHPRTNSPQAYVVEYVEPMEGNEAAFGFDLASSSERRASVELARDSGNPVATSAITLVQETGTQRGVLVIVPVFSDSTAQTAQTVEARRESFSGVVLIVFRVGDLVAAAVDTERIGLELADSTLGSEPELLYSTPDDGSTPVSASAGRVVEFASRRWEILVWPAAGSLASDRSVLWIVGGFGALATIFASVFVLMLATGRDRAKAEAALLTADLQEINKTLSRSNEDLERFAYVASHDLQTPVRNVANSVTLLRDHLDDHPDPAVDEYLGFLGDAAQRMQALIHGLLEYSRLGREDFVLSAGIAISEVVDQSILNLGDEISELEASVTRAPLPEVRGDAVLLGRVFDNLVGNSLKYAHPDRTPEVTIEAVRDGDYWRISVTDNGLGIEPEYRDSVFTMFRRLHRHEDIPGSGIGLGVCQRIVDLHGGELKLASSDEGGSEFVFTLPVDS